MNVLSLSSKIDAGEELNKRTHSVHEENSSLHMPNINLFGICRSVNPYNSKGQN